MSLRRRSSVVSLTLALAWVLLCLSSTAALAAPPEERTGEYIIEILDPSARALVPPKGETADDRSRKYDAAKAAIKAAIGSQGQVLKSYSHLPLMHVKLPNEQAAQALRHRPDVAAVRPNKVRTYELDQSLPLIQQPAAVANGLTGAGTSVAILDTGVDYTRAAFGNCTAPGVPSTCRVAFAKDFAWEDGYLDYSGHGTNVAGIAAGVAVQTKILALDVFEYSGAYDSDIIDAINWTIENKNVYNIASLNMSLGDGSSHSTPCADDSLAPAVANARTAGIVVSVSSGNSALTNGIGSPACAPGAVSVGAVYDADVGAASWSYCYDSSSAADKVVCFSNSAPILTMLAPGAKITAAGLTYSGTSMSAPHVAGAAAVMREVMPSATVDDIVSRLTLTGDMITDHRNSLIKPRLNLAAAADPTGFAEDIAVNGSFEEGSGKTVPGWTLTGPAERTTNTSFWGSASLWMGGVTATSDSAAQTFTVPADATLASLWVPVSIVTAENLMGAAADYFYVELIDGDTTVALLTRSNADAAANGNSPRAFLTHSFDLRSYKGKTLTVKLRSTNTNTNVTSFFVDVVRVLISREDPATIDAITSNPATIKELTPTTFTAEVTGGTKPLSFRFSRKLSTASDWTVVRDWGLSGAYQWTPQLGDAGTYSIQVEVRSQGLTEVDDTHSQDFVVAVLPKTPTLLSVTADKASPQNGGTTIVWTATSENGVGPILYRFWRYSASNNTWTLVRDFDPSPKWTWVVPNGTSGQYIVQVDAKSSGGVGDTVALRASAMVINPVVAEFVSLTADKPSPQNSGAVITWTALARGGVSPLSYRFWRHSTSNGQWTVMRDWSTSNTASLNTNGIAGDLTIQVDIRSNNATELDVFGRSSTMTVVALPLTVSVTANKTSPVTPYQYIMWTASSTGGIAPIQYRFWRYNAASNTWSLGRDWNTYASYEWYADVTGEVLVQVEARSAGKTAAEAIVRSAAINVQYLPAKITSIYPTNLTSRPISAGGFYWYVYLSDGVYPHEYRFYLYHAESNTWSLLRDFSTSYSYYWTPSVVGTYILQVDVRSYGKTAIEDSKRTPAFKITNSVSSAEITSPTGKLIEGAPLTWTATASGPAAAFEYRFWRFDYAAGTWSLGQDFSASNSWTWNTGAGNAGTYLVQVDVRAVGETGTTSSRTAPFVIEKNPALLSLTSVTASAPNARSGDTLAWTAAYTGEGAAEFRFWLFNYSSGTWSLLRDFGAVNTTSWTPIAPGNYLVQVDARVPGGPVASSLRSAVYNVQP